MAFDRPLTIEQWAGKCLAAWKRKATCEHAQAYAQAYAQASSSRGKKAATARWSKKKPEESTEKPAESVDNSQKDAHAYAQALHGKCPPEPEPEYKTSVVNDDVDNSDSSASASTAPSSFAGPAESNSTYMYFLRFFALLC